jgi:hypothetical protein
MRTLIGDIRAQLDETGCFRYIDDDWGQLDDYSNSPPTKWPCALVDIIEAKPENIGQHLQTLDCTILIRIADLRTANSSKNAPGPQKDKYYEILATADVIFARLHGWHKAGSSYGTISRVGFRRHHRDDGIREYHILFRTILKASAAAIVTEDKSEFVPSIIKPNILTEIEG